MRSIKNLFIAFLLVLFVLPVSAQTERTIKRKVAIGRFSNETQYGKGMFYDKENDPMGKQAMDILSSKLAASGKFILLERGDMDLLVAESGDKMEKIGADYIIVGSGLFGATFAYSVKKTGRSCLVIEKRSHLGGNI